MAIKLREQRSLAWYDGTREQFLSCTREQIADQLAGRAASESLEIESSQTEEWRQSVELLQKNLDERIPIIRNLLSSTDGAFVRHVVLEFDFRRRGLRMDCVLLADGVVFVIEFKRSKLGRSDYDQVMGYAVNLLEFHAATREWCEKTGGIVVPLLVLTAGRLSLSPAWPGLAGHSWARLIHRPIECDSQSINLALRLAFENRAATTSIEAREWLSSSFSPSSSILDATLSLYGNHDVVAIDEHAAPKEAINASASEIRAHIRDALSSQRNHLVFLSGAPGAGKTLVGLDIVMRGDTAGQSIFVTGNAPLVDVLNRALEGSYRRQGASGTTWAATGYVHTDARLVASAASFKIVKAHHFLGERGTKHRQTDSRILVFDEAQRTYEKNRIVLGKRLPDHEADLILSAQMDAFPQGGTVVVALVGHNQAIGRGERGITAWLEAADRCGWSFSISDETLRLGGFDDVDIWANHAARKVLGHGHLYQSMRFYRNSAIEEWVAALLQGDAALAASLASTLDREGAGILLTRDIDVARRWARAHAVGGQRAGIIASGQGRRLAAEGLFVDQKPDIATWMLAPSTDIRSSNALETVQNQYQIQGLELDYCIVCWDADLRREQSKWGAYRVSGDDWQRDSLIKVAKNGYRVLLTRARKAMIIFVPRGDLSGEDRTRSVGFYDGTWEYLKACGGKELAP